jgi:ribonuclease P protein component
MESDREQAHLPAEQPPSGEDARVPVAHAHPRGSRDHLRAPPQGARRAVGLIRRQFPDAPVLPSANRMRRSTEFTQVVRSGSRVRRGSLVVHLHPAVTSSTPHVGLVVGKSVGGSVVRHRVSRRLRAQLAQRVDRLPANAGLVIRALPDAAVATSAQFAADLDAALSRLLGAER